MGVSKEKKRKREGMRSNYRNENGHVRTGTEKKKREEMCEVKISRGNTHKQKKRAGGRGGERKEELLKLNGIS